MHRVRDEKKKWSIYAGDISPPMDFRVHRDVAYDIYRLADPR